MALSNLISTDKLQNNINAAPMARLLHHATDETGAMLATGVNNPLPIVQQGATSGGFSVAKTIAAATTNATVVKASAGQLYKVVVNNQNAAVRYLKVYNKATAPTVGTDVPVLTLALQPSVNNNFDFTDIGLAFSTGISFALTTGVADNDTGAVSANEHVVNVCYK